MLIEPPTVFDPPPPIFASDRKINVWHNTYNQQIHHGDCLDIMPQIRDNSIDMILCDLPYGTTDCKWDTIIPFDLLWAQYKRVIKPNCAIVLTASQPFTSALVMSNVRWFKHEWIWNKVTARGHLVAKKRPMAQHENIVVFAKKGHLYFPQMIQRPSDKIEYRNRTEYARTEIMGGGEGNGPECVIYDKWYPKTIITISNAGSPVTSVHPTQKPVELFEYLIRTYTEENANVLDNCCGSGTTGIACQNTKRNFLLIEKDYEYFRIAQQRLADNAE